MHTCLRMLHRARHHARLAHLLAPVDMEAILLDEGCALCQNATHQVYPPDTAITNGDQAATLPITGPGAAQPPDASLPRINSLLDLMTPDDISGLQTEDVVDCYFSPETGTGATSVVIAPANGGVPMILLTTGACAPCVCTMRVHHARPTRCGACRF
jgi:hypothetical protein